MWKKILIGLVALVVVIGVVITFALDGIVKSAIEEVGSSVLQTPVKVDSVHLSLFSGSGKLTGLSIDNPKGYPKGPLLKTKTIAFKVDLRSLLSNTLTVEYINVVAPDIQLYFGPGGTNLQALKNQMKSSSKPSQAQSKPAAKHSSSKHIVIKKLNITQGQVVTHGNKLSTLTLSPIHLTHLGEKQAATVPQVTQVIIQTLLINALEKAGAGSFGERLEGLANRVKSLF